LLHEHKKNFPNLYKEYWDENMKLLMLDGSEKNDSFSGKVNSTVVEVLKGKKSLVTNIILNEHDVKGCVGCLGCFFKTPGVCRFKDLVQQLPSTYVKSDIVVLITRVTFGGFSSILAKAYDRLVIQLESHLFEVSSGVMRRKKRYRQSYPSLLAIGLEEEADMEDRSIFNALVQKNVFEHLRSPEHETLFFPKQTSVFEMKQKIDRTLLKIKG
jgi:multimeric flavodoxin WrbA